MGGSKSYVRKSLTRIAPWAKATHSGSSSVSHATHNHTTTQPHNDLDVHADAHVHVHDDNKDNLTHATQPQRKHGTLTTSNPTSPTHHHSRHKKGSVLKIADADVEKGRSIRKAVRRILDDVRVEMVLLAVVVLYTFAIFFDLGVKRLVFPDGCTVLTQCDTSRADNASCGAWIAVFLNIDVVLLSFFFVELCVRLYAFGVDYFKDFLAALDGLIVVVSVIFLALQLATDACVDDGQSSSSHAVSSAQLIARIARVVRVFRIVVVMNKISSGQKQLKVVRQQTKYRRVGSPVERVIDILTRLRKAAELREDRHNLNFVIDVIVANQLYKVNVQDQSATVMGAEINALLGFNLTADNSRRGAGRRDGKGSFAATDSANLRALTPWVDKLIRDHSVTSLLATTSSWDFDVFALDDLTGTQSLIILFIHLVQVFDLDLQLNLNLPNLVRFLTKLQSGYRKVPFHGYLHACDSLHATAYFLSQPRLRQIVDAFDMYVLLLAAAMHDHDHRGLNNQYYVNSSDELAILYNDTAVLEMHHLASSWSILSVDSHNPLAGFSHEQFLDARTTITQAVLGTEPRLHFEHVTYFKTRVAANAFDAPELSDTRLLLTTTLYAADICSPAKAWKYASVWAARMMQEFFEQGDREREEGLAVSPFMDRHDTDIAQCRKGFIMLFVLPFFEEYGRFVSERVGRELVSQLEANAHKWETEGEAALGPILNRLRPSNELDDEDLDTVGTGPSLRKRGAGSIVPSSMAARLTRGSGRRDSSVRILPRRSSLTGRERRATESDAGRTPAASMSMEKSILEKPISENGSSWSIVGGSETSITRKEMSSSVRATSMIAA